MGRFFFALTMLVVAGCSASSDADIKVAKDAYTRGDYATTLRLMRPLAEHGNGLAQMVLSNMYGSGKGVPQNDAESVKWLRRAADGGWAQGQVGVAFMYEEGRGVPQDYVEAHKWYNLAASHPVSENFDKFWHDMATEKRDSVARKMTPEQVGEAQKLAREWKPK